MLLDVHCHLTDQHFSESLDATIKESIKKNVGIIISAGLNVEDNRKVLEISKKYEIVKAALGIYPIDALSIDDDSIENEVSFIGKNKNKIIAISEVGLDYLYSKESKKQKEVFQKFIELSEKIKKPLIIHSRKAEFEVIEMLESSKIKTAIFHSFGGNKNLIKKIIENKWFFSIPPVIVRSSNYQTLVDMAPLQSLLTETDSPYQSPLKNEMNKPYLVIESIKKISEIKNLDPIETENIILMNFQKIFRKWKTI